jgi:murein L,D-transpeptidase YcbB/YkuD
LLATGDLVAGTSLDTDEFDGSLERAVYQFQLRHGLQADGIAGPETLATMNIPIDQRIGQIRANMERLRWISRQLPKEYLLVDIAGFSVKQYSDGKENWSTRAVVGKPFRATPVFRSSMTHIVLNPSWTVPPTILAEDFLPLFRVDSTQLKKKNLSVIDNSGHEVDPATIDWTSATRKNFRYQLRQRPGPGNALGRIKFMFPNDYFVYLHDTPSKNLFGSSSRAYSSGCIRIEKPLELATLLLQKNNGWNYQRLLSALGNGQTRTIKLDWQIPVLLMYFTAEALDENRILFRNDLYNRDRTIIDALDRPLSHNASTDLAAWYH